MRKNWFQTQKSKPKNIIELDEYRDFIRKKLEKHLDLLVERAETCDDKDLKIITSLITNTSLILANIERFSPGLI